MNRRIHAAVLAIATLFSAAVAAAQIGDALPALTLKDQHDTPHTLDASIKRIYANADRKGDKLMAGLKELDQARLDAQKAIVVADISEAPGFVKRIIRSSLKDRRYTVWMDVAGSTKSMLPRRPDQVTVIDLEQGRIKAIRYVSDAEALQRELAQP